MEDTALVELTNAERALIKAETIQETVPLINDAEAARIWAKKAGLGLSISNRAAKFRIHAEHKTGELLAMLERGKGNRFTVEPDSVSGSISEYASTIDEAGIHKRQAQRWQKLAKYPWGTVEDVMDDIDSMGEEVTGAAVLKRISPHVSHNSGQVEWYTPADIIDAARATMGVIYWSRW